MSVTELLIEVHRRQQELQDGVFRHPPSDWPGFQRALGQWMGLETASDLLTDLIEGDKDDQ